MFSSKELTRYSRNIFLEEIGKKGQEKFKSAKVAVIGSGGLGSPILLYLAAAGIGEIHIIDSDYLELTNLQRQIIFTTENIKMSKAETAKAHLEKLNPEIKVVSHETRLCRRNISEILFGIDIILEGSDNFETKFLVNDFAYFNKIPLIIGGILRFDGQIIGINPEKTFCYRCIFSDIPDRGLIPSCAEAGVLGSIAGVVGSLQASECLKYLLSFDDTIMGRILQIDLKNLEFRKLTFSKNPKCKLCGEHPTLIDLSHHSLDWVGEC